MLTKSQLQTIKQWAETNNLSNDTLFRFALTDDGWSLSRLNIDEPDDLDLLVNFLGTAPDVDFDRAYTLSDLAYLTDVRDAKTKREFIEYLESVPEQRFFQAVVNFIKDKTNLTCWSMRICKDPNEPIGLDVFHIEGDDHLNES